MNPSIPASFRLDTAVSAMANSNDSDSQNYRLALLQAILEKEQRTEETSNVTGPQHHLPVSGQQNLPAATTSTDGLQALMNSNELVNSILGGASSASSSDRVDPIQRLLSLQQQEATPAISGLPLLENKLQLQRILAETASQEQQRRSLEDLIRLNRIEQLRLQESVLGVQPKTNTSGSSSGSNNIRNNTATLPSLQQKSPRSQGLSQDSGLMLLPGILRDKVSAPIAGMTAVGGASQFLPLLDRPRQDNIPSPSSLLGSNLKRKADSAGLLDDLAMKKRPAIDRPSKMVSFPLPLARERSSTGAAVTSDKNSSGGVLGCSKLASYELQWNSLQSLGAQRDIFVDRIHRNKIKLIGETRSAILEETRRAGQKTSSTDTSDSSEDSSKLVVGRYAML